MTPHEPHLRRHLRAGWIGLGVFLALGIALETLHAFKTPLYLDVGNANRRLMWTLAHAHGTLFSLVQLAAAGSINLYPAMARRMAGVIFWGLLVGQFIMPAGFLLGGVWLQGGEPGPGVFLVPIGAAGMMAAVGAAIWRVCFFDDERIEAGGSAEPSSPAGTPTAPARRRRR